MTIQDNIRYDIAQLRKGGNLEDRVGWKAAEAVLSYIADPARRLMILHAMGLDVTEVRVRPRSDAS